MKNYLIGATIIILASCSTAKVGTTQLDDQANWRYYKTFDFYQLNIGGDTVAASTIDRFNDLKAAINDEMQKAGFKRSNIKPDLLINIGLAIKDEVLARPANSLQDVPRYISQRNYYWKTEEVSAGHYRDGTAIIDLVDAASKTLVWRGTLKRVIPAKTEKIQETIRQGVEQLFKQNPVPVNKLIAVENAQ